MEISLQFEAADLEIIETIDFDEQMQRPEELRFFTLEEQLTDYFQKVVPKKKHVSRAEYAKIENEVQRIRKIYTDIISFTNTDYRIDTGRKRIQVPWLKPIYGSFQYETYSYAEKFQPLFEEGVRRNPNFYPTLLKAIPRPYRSDGAMGVPIKERTVLVNEEGKGDIEALGSFVRPKLIMRDDGTIEMTSVEMDSTGDDIRRIGFFIEERRLDMPRPLAEHPFLSSSASSKILTAEPLLDVFPTVEAILSHAVPTTTDPYVEGRKYLKLYDVSLSQVPWNSWKERFPPAGTINTPPPVLSVSFPVSEDTVAPSERLQKVYNSKWEKAVYPRLWLMKQEDAGLLVTKMLLSEAGEFGLIAPDVMNERPKIQLPESTADECLNVSNFEEFLSSGVFRAPTYKKEKDDWVQITSGVCAPTTFVTQERREMLNAGKKVWTETTQTNIQRDYVSLFKFYQPVKAQIGEKEYEKYRPADTSELAENVLTILKDDTLLPPDKAYNIRILLKEITPMKNRFLDVNNVEIVCNHTLALLDGDLDANRFDYYTKWTSIEDGFRVCKFCGVQVNSDTYVAQDDFDDNGRLIVSHEVLDEKLFKRETHPTSFATSLSELRNVFNMLNAGEALIIFMLNQLQVLPSENQLSPVLGNIRKVSVSASKLPPAARNKVEGMLGIAGMVVLLQTHTPFLVPRRSFGSRTMKLSGFPRDTDDANEAPVLGMILSVIKEAVEAFPTSFAEPLSTILREVVNNRKKVREESVKFIKQAYTEFKVQFESAKVRSETVVDETTLDDNITLPAIVPKKTDFSIGETQGSETTGECTTSKPRTTIVGKMRPLLPQRHPEIGKTKPSSNAVFIPPRIPTLKYSFPSSKEIQKGVSLGFPKTLKLDAIRKFVDDGVDGVSLLSLLTRILDLLAPLSTSKKVIRDMRDFAENANSFENASLFRDAVKGKIFELFDFIKTDAGAVETIKVAMTRDLTMNMILLTKEKSEREVKQLRTMERDMFTKVLKSMSDRERETMKQMLDIGIAQHLISVSDRRRFVEELNIRDMESRDKDEDLNLLDVPEGGHTTRDYIESEEQRNEKGGLLEADRGDYGDVHDRPHDDYSMTYNYDGVGDV